MGSLAASLTIWQHTLYIAFLEHVQVVKYLHKGSPIALQPGLVKLMQISCAHT